MKTRVEETIARHDKGFNCAQAVACTYCDLVGADEETMFRMTEALGLGMGGMQGTCGAISGALALVGLLNSSGDLENPTTKAKTYGLNKEILENFQKRNGSVICHELKGIGTGKVLRSCPDCIMDACEFFENLYETKLKK